MPTIITDFGETDTHVTTVHVEVVHVVVDVNAVVVNHADHATTSTILADLNLYMMMMIMMMMMMMIMMMMMMVPVDTRDQGLLAGQWNVCEQRTLLV